MAINLEELVEKLCGFKKQLFAETLHVSDCDKEGYKKIEIWNGEWSYTSHFRELPFLPENEELTYNLEPVWRISYTGGIIAPYYENSNFVIQVNGFLRQALIIVDPVRTFRGPKKFNGKSPYIYTNPNHSDLRNARGNKEVVGSERILYNDKKVWLMDYMWELIIDKK